MNFGYEIACALGQIWHLYNSPSFLRYVADTFGREIVRLPKFDKLLIAQASTGDVSTGVIGGEIERWWFTTTGAIEEYDSDRFEFSTRNGFYTEPIIKFFIDSSRITIGERLGIDMSCRKIGRIEFKDGAAIISDLRVIWSTSMIINDGRPI